MRRSKRFVQVQAFIQSAKKPSQSQSQRVRIFRLARGEGESRVSLASSSLNPAAGGLLYFLKHKDERDNEN